MAPFELDFHVRVKDNQEVKVKFIKGPLPVALLAAAACSSAAAPVTSGCPAGGGAVDDGGPPTEFVAYASSFAGFQNWSTAQATAENDAGDGLHGVGPLEVYWNQAPPHGSTSFPVGTIIVKETEETDPTARIVFAMVKRGDGYNATGANGWEWFSLQNNDDCTVTILWRGLVAPPGQTYANQAIGDCNGCHGLASSNDYVWDSALLLSNF
jgi:Cytochrome P460